MDVVVVAPTIATTTKSSVKKLDKKRAGNTKPKTKGKKQKKNKTNKSNRGTAISIGSIVTPGRRTEEREDGDNNVGDSRVGSEGSAKDMPRIEAAAATTETSITPTTFPQSNRHPWELDPKWNIAPPKKGQRTLMDYCRKYKAPPPEVDAEGNIKSSSSSVLKQRRLRAEAQKNQQNQKEDGSVVEVSEASASATAAAAGPQVQVINGEIVIEESSLLLHQHKTIEQLDEELGGQEVVEDSALLTATYQSFRRHPVCKKQKWSPEDTYDLYTAIRSYGPDFSLIETFFKERYTRKEIRLKFKRELRDNEKLMDLALYGGGSKNQNAPKLDIPFQVTTNKDDSNTSNENKDAEDNKDELNNDDNAEPEVVVEEDEQPQLPLTLEDKYANLFDDEEKVDKDQQLNSTTLTDTTTNPIVEEDIIDPPFSENYHHTDMTQSQELTQTTTNTSTTRLSILGSVQKKTNKKKKNKFKVVKKK